MENFIVEEEDVENDTETLHRTVTLDMDRRDGTSGAPTNGTGTFLTSIERIAAQYATEHAQEEEEAPALEEPQEDAPVDHFEFWKTQDIDLEMQYAPGTFTSGRVFPPTKGRKPPANTTWDARMNAYIRTDLSAPASSPKHRPPQDTYWNPCLPGWRRTKAATQDALDASVHLTGPPQNFGNHLSDLPLVGFSITIGCRGSNLPKNHDKLIFEFFQKYATEYYLGQEYGTKAKEPHRHWQCAGLFHGVHDPSTKTEMELFIRRVCGFPKGYKPTPNVVVRICDDDADYNRVIGYCQKDKNKGSFAFFTNISEERCKEAYDAREDRQFKLEEGKTVISRNNIFKEVWNYWRLSFKPAEVSFSEVLVMMVQSERYVLGSSLVYSGKFDPAACDALWTMYVRPTDPAYASKRAVEQVLFQGGTNLTKLIQDRGVWTEVELRCKLRGEGFSFAEDGAPSA